MAEATEKETMPAEFPITIEIKVHMKQGRNMVELSGAKTIGRLPTKQEILKILAQAILMGDEMGAEPFANPTEFWSRIASDMYGTDMIVAGSEPEFAGYTQAELDEAIVAEHERRDADSDDDES